MKKKQKPLLLTNEVVEPTKFEWMKKNIVIIPVIAAIVAGSFTSIRYVLNLTDTINANQQDINGMKRDVDVIKGQFNDLRNRLSAAEATWNMAENLYRQLADQVREQSYDIKDLSR